MSKPKFEDTLPLEDEIVNKPAFEDTFPVDNLSGFEKTLNVLDIPGSLVRTGVEAAISPEKEIIPAVTEQFKATVESPTTAAMSAPGETKVFEKLASKASEILGETPLTPEQRIQREKEYPISTGITSAVGGLVTGMALDPSSWFRPSKTVTKPVRKALESASERQAARAISKFATKADVLKEGADLDVIGSRLVAEDLQGLIRTPVKLYETLVGQRHLQKVGQTLPETLQIRKSVKEGGKIAETSKEITNAIKTVEDQYKMAPQVPANIMMKQLLENAKKNLSQVSAETVDMAKVEDILTKALKPSELLTSAQVGGRGDWAMEIPTEMTLEQLHQLRKNVGQQVSDRAFYAGADASMKMETEVLRDLYRTLGDIIEKNLRGKTIKIGSNTVDAGDYYKAQNNKLKSFMDVKSMLEYQPTEALKSPDAAATIASMITKGGIYGATAAGASLAGLPVNPLAAGAVGAGFGAAQAASEAVKTSTPEYLTSILKTAGKIQATPLLPEAVTRGTIQYMREGQPVSEFGREPQSVGLTPRQLISYRVPRSTQGILEQKDKVIAKLVQSGAPSEMVDTVAQALNGDAEDLSNIAPLLMMQMPQMFEKSKYKVFDGKFLDPNDRAKAADEISKRDSIDSIQKARMINRINKFNEVPEGM